MIALSQEDIDLNFNMELNRAKISIPIIAMSLGNSYYTIPDVLLKMALWLKQQENIYVQRRIYF